MSEHARSYALRAAIAAVVATVMTAGCGTVRIPDAAGADRGDLVLLKGDPKMGPFGNAVVELLRVDSEELDGTESKALVAPGPHVVTARCSVPMRDALGISRLAFTAGTGRAYALQLRLLHRPPGCAVEIIEQDSGEVVSRPEGE